MGSNYKEVCERRPGSTRGENMRIGAEMWAEKPAEEKEARHIKEARSIYI